MTILLRIQLLEKESKSLFKTTSATNFQLLDKNSRTSSVKFIKDKIARLNTRKEILDKLERINEINYEDSSETESLGKISRSRSSVK